MIALAVVVAYNLGLAEHRKQELHTVLGRNPEEVAVPIVVRTEAAGVVQVVHVEVVVAHMEAAEVAVPIVVHTEAAGVVRAVRMVVAHTAVEVAVPNLAVAVGLDHKTWIIPSCLIFSISNCYIRGNLQYHTTDVKANRQVSIRKVDP